MIRRRVLGTLGTLAVTASVALALAGCAPTAPIPTPAPGAIVGTWHHGAATMTFDADGTFSMRDVPLGVVEQSKVALGAAPHGPGETARGTWVIGSGGTDVGGAPGVQVDFTSPKRVGPDYGVTLVVSDDLPPQLYVFLGHPDSATKYSFTKR